MAVLTLLAAAGAAAGEKGDKPALDVRTAPRVGFSPINVLIVAELRGGEDLEDYYCPEIEWDFDDGTKSTRESDCPPFEPGTPIERRFSVEHRYSTAGHYRVTVTLRRNNRTLARATGRVNVRPGVSDPANLRGGGEPEF